jgi:hypothetical protein
MEYEFIREIFNNCSGNQMRDVFVEEISTENTDKYMEQYLVGERINSEKNAMPDGSIIYDVVIDSLHQRFSFTPI